MTNVPQKPVPQLKANDIKLVIGRSPFGKLSITHIPGTTTDAIKAAMLDNISRQLAAKAKKSDVAIVIIEDPQF